MTLLQISDTHNLHRLLTDLPVADVIVHCGDFSHHGSEEEVLDFLNWFIELPYSHKIFVTGNHDVCLWDAEGIEDLPENIHFLQDKGINIDGVSFFGIGYDHNPNCIPEDTDVVITHEPPMNILDRSNGISWGNLDIRRRIEAISPRYHLYGHAHEAYGIRVDKSTTYSNAALADNWGKIKYPPRVFEI